MFATLWFICNYPNRQQQQQDSKQQQQQRELCPQVARRGEANVANHLPRQMQTKAFET